MALSTRVWGAGKRVLLGGALVLTYLIFAAAAMRLAIKTRDVVVPALTGKSVPQAGAELAPAGLNLKGEETRRVDAAVPAGTIVSQEPQPRVHTRRERSGKVLVSAGPPAMSVPALLGEAERTGVSRGGGAGGRAPASERAGGSGGAKPPGRIQSAPSLLSADFARLGDAVRLAERAGADMIHFDVMDGHFVPNITMGPPVLKSLTRVSRLPIDVHLMIESPDRYVGAFVEAAAASRTGPFEARVHLHPVRQV